LSANLAEQFEYGLIRLDMLVLDDPGSSGLVFIDGTPRSPAEHIALEKARKYDVDAVYFRRFESDRTSVPQIYIYDFTSRVENKDEIGELHRKLWNSGQVPLFFIFTKSEVKIFNCLKSPDLEKDTDKVITSPLETIHLAAEVESELEERKLKEFSARKFDNGSFWDTSEYRDKFRQDDSSYEKLLKYLKWIRSEIIKKKILDPPIVHKLLVMAILLKYLEERVDHEGNTVFPDGFFARVAEGARSFTDVLKKKGACLQLFDFLSQHFNGEIFKWEDEGERELLSQTDLTEFAKFLEGRTEVTGQRTLWPLYSFNDLPIELISNIYEEFLGNEKGVVYTPPYLVHFLIDEVMPLESPQEEFKVLDPACGSGVFLVAAYQRIIDWWRIRNDWQKPDLDTLKNLLRDSIYGVDILPEAVRLSIFSLSLVLLDELSPKEIWGNLKFDNLKQTGNLFEKDFFQLILDQKLEEKFDLVIGNPPFKKFTTRWAEQIEEKREKERVPIPNKQLALLFLEQSLSLGKTNGLLCMILPSGPFLYNNSALAFRKYFLQTCNVKQILDFTALAEILFGSSKFPTVAVFATNDKPNLKNILHVTFRRTKVSKEKIYLELDHYDLHHVAYEDALNSTFIWKANLVGGSRLHHLILRLSKLRKFGDYIKEKMKKSGWVMADGYKVGDENEIISLKHYIIKRNSLSPKEMIELRRLEKKYQKADYLTGKKTLATEAFTSKGIDESRIHTLGIEYFERNRVENKLIFKGPHILIKKGVGRNSIPITFRADDLSFKDTIIGIHAPLNQQEELKEIEKRLKGKKIALFYAAASSGKFMINKATVILKKDIDNLPFPENEKELELSEIDKILVDDVLDYMLDFRRKGENSIIVQPANLNQLHMFGETYCKILNTVYEKFQPYDPIVTDNFVCFPIYYGEKPGLETGDLDQFERHLDRLVHKKFGRYLRITRIIRIYDNNVIYLVKPKQLRYWLRSVAVRDADETFEDLVKQGY
jgi:type I restriction-modification system DNA methylase subunit